MKDSISIVSAAPRVTSACATGLSSTEESRIVAPRLSYRCLCRSVRGRTTRLAFPLFWMIRTALSRVGSCFGKKLANSGSGLTKRTGGLSPILL